MKVKNIFRASHGWIGTTRLYALANSYTKLLPMALHSIGTTLQHS